MNQKDSIIRIIDKGGNIRVVIARTTHLVDEARIKHRSSPTATAALGRVLTGTIMMALDLKGNESVTVRIDGGGPLGPIIAVGESDGSVRGYLSEPEIEVPEKSPGKLNVGLAVGHDGLMEVVRDMGMKSTFTGRVALVSGEIAEDFAYYFTSSEQIPSLVALGVVIEKDYSVGGAGGVFIQALPGADESVLKKLETEMHGIGAVSSLVKTYSLEEIAGKLFGESPYNIIEKRPVIFKCRCSYDKVASIIGAMNDNDITETFEQEGKIEISCNFCNKIYTFNRTDVEKIKKISLREV
ncbi:MAG: Hsp33 family molecular chaperone HslO [Chitinophagales bacterium]